MIGWGRKEALADASEIEICEISKKEISKLEGSSPGFPVPVDNRMGNTGRETTKSIRERIRTDWWKFSHACSARLGCNRDSTDRYLVCRVWLS